MTTEDGNVHECEVHTHTTNYMVKYPNVDLFIVSPYTTSDIDYWFLWFKNFAINCQWILNLILGTEFMSVAQEKLSS